jgi:Helix-turn-helix domain
VTERIQARGTAPLLLRTNEAAELLGYAPKTVRARARLGILRSVRAGERGYLRISAASVEDFAAERGAEVGPMRSRTPAARRRHGVPLAARLYLPPSKRRLLRIRRGRSSLHA